MSCVRVRLCRKLRWNFLLSPTSITLFACGRESCFVRLSDLLEGAPDTVLHAIAHILLAKMYRKPIDRYTPHAIAGTSPRKTSPRKAILCGRCVGANESKVPRANL